MHDKMFRTRASRGPPRGKRSMQGTRKILSAVWRLQLCGNKRSRPRHRYDLLGESGAAMSKEPTEPLGARGSGSRSATAV